MTDITKDELHDICELTYKLTALKHSECNHLAIENFSTKLFGMLISELKATKEGRYRPPFID